MSPLRPITTDDISSLLEARDTLTQMLQRQELGPEVSAQIEHVLEIIEKSIRQYQDGEGREGTMM